jgi:hypothetical protein
LGVKQELLLMVELWVTKGQQGQQQSNTTSTSSSSSPQKQLGQLSEQQLLGLVKVPLSLGGACTAAAANTPLLLQCTELLASGDYPVWDVIEGKSNGMLHVEVSLDDSKDRQQGDQRVTGGRAFGDQVQEIDSVQGEPSVLAVRHTLHVTIQSATNLPSSEHLQAAGEPVPCSRFICYNFPSE